MLDRLLDGAKGVDVRLSDGRVVTLTRADPLSRERFRRVWQAEACTPPEYTPEEFDDVIRGLFLFADKCAAIAAV
jgi:hypothetical protein